MADDIDIEEHDVLDNPKLKNIFPDITKIKTEIPDIDEEDHFMTDDSMSQASLQTSSRYEEHDLYVLHNNRIVLGSKPSQGTSSNQNMPVVFSSIQSNYNNYPTFDYNNVTVKEEIQDYSYNESQPGTVMILGSKVSEDVNNGMDYDDHDIKNSVVVLEDWGPRLHCNACYCKACKILFPTINCLDAHKMSAHSFLIALSTNRAIKSTSKGVDPKNTARKSTGFPNVPSTSSAKFCNHCNRTFPDDTTLIKHLYEVLTSKFKCNDCGAVYNKEAEYKLHVESHALETSVHDDNSIECHQCHICGCIYKQEILFLKHMRGNHSVQKPNVVKKKVKSNCLFCDSHFIKTDSLNRHILAKHSSYYVSQPARTAPKAIQRKKPTPPQSQIIVPSSIVFKCNKCNTHFTSCVAALLHSKSCLGFVGAWRCADCRRRFKSEDKVVHTHQHSVTIRFNIHEISEWVCRRTLCRCPECRVYFNEKDLFAHFKEGCSTPKFTVCSVCVLQVSVLSLKDHNLCHQIDKLSKNDFILIEYIKIRNSKPIEVTPTPELKRKIPDDIDATPIKKVKQECNINDDRPVLYYCAACKCYMKPNSSFKQIHLTSKCEMSRKQFVKWCKLCGLQYSSSRHADLHSTGRRLHDFRFVRLQDNTYINPPIPDFPKCNKCSVHFVSKVARRAHECNDAFKTCKYCKNKFSDLAYKLHVPFHEYSANRRKQFQIATSTPKSTNGMPELLKKYHSLIEIWNILYLCKFCNIVCDSYDKVVEHCQDHFNKMESYDVTITNCEICELIFDGTCFAKHQELHKNSDINKSSFNVLKYECNNLFSEKWLDFFGDLPTQQVEQIVSRSIYRCCRNIKMRIIRAGCEELTLYKCEKCKKHVSAQNVPKHFKSTLCSIKKPGFSCSHCKRSFATVDCRDLHKETMKIQKPTRIVSFNDPRDVQFNKALVPAVELSPAMQNIEDSVPKTHPFYIESEKKNPVYSYFKCKSCDCCVTSKRRVRFHKCSTPSMRRQCPKCGLWFTNRYILTHKNLHKSFPKVSKRNIKVILFNPLQSKYNASKISKTNQKIVPKIYKCSCGIHLTSSKTVEKHLEVCSPDNKISKENCSQCGLLFPTDLLVSHLCSHHSNDKFSNFEVEEVTPSKKISLKCGSCKETFYSKSELIKHLLKCTSKQTTMSKSPDPKATVYKCYKCDIHYLAERSLEYHFSVNHKVVEISTCSKCNLKFSCRTLAAHMNYHHAKLKSSLINVQVIDPSADKYVTKHEDPSFAKVNMKLYSKDLFKCTLCEQHFIVKASLLKHFMGKKHHKKGKFVAFCKVCGLKFSKNTVGRHIYIQHTKLKLKRKDLRIIKIDSAVNLMKYMKAPKLERYVDNKTTNEGKPGRDSKGISSSRLHNSITKKSPRNVKMYIPKPRKKFDEVLSDRSGEMYYDDRLFVCKICSLHYMRPKSLKTHQNTDSKHTTPKNPCNHCGLLFSATSLKIHIEIHHEKMKLKREDFRIFSEDTGNEKSSSSLVVTESNDNDMNTSESNEDTTNIVAVKAKFLDYYLYKCSKCSLHFIKDSSIKCHLIDERHSTPPVKCNKCGLQFGMISLKRHQYLHHNKFKMARKDFIILNIASEADINGILYKCRICHSHYWSQEHFATHSHFIKKTRCRECDLVFSTFSLSKHKMLHHQKMGLKLGDFRIIEQPSDEVANDDLEVDENEIAYENEKQVKSKSGINERVYSEEYLSTKDISDYNECLHKCSTCGLHYMSYASMRTHRCKPENQRPCPKCGYIFNSLSLSLHTYIHHEKLKLTFEEIRVVNYDHQVLKGNDTTTDIGTDDGEVSLDIDIDGSKNVAIDSCDEEKSTTNSKSSGNYNLTEKLKEYIDWTVYNHYLYKCLECSSHFLRFNSLLKHRHEALKVSCSECHLKFTKWSLMRHEYIQHKVLGLKLEDFCIVDKEDTVISGNPNFTVSKVNLKTTESTPDKDNMHSRSTLESIKSQDAGTVTESPINDSDDASSFAMIPTSNADKDENIVSQSTCSKNKDSHEDETMDESTSSRNKNSSVDRVSENLDIVSQSTTSRRKSSSADEENTTNRTKKSIVKLYKCGKCKVYFITQATCYKHTLNHATLESKDFIECKLCGFQFRITSLFKHIQIHHKEEFNLENILIEEYQPVISGTPKIDIYFAVDQSKLVSTTSDKDSTGVAGCGTDAIIDTINSDNNVEIESLVNLSDSDKDTTKDYTHIRTCEVEPPITELITAVNNIDVGSKPILTDKINETAKEDPSDNSLESEPLVTSVGIVEKTPKDDTSIPTTAVEPPTTVIAAVNNNCLESEPLVTSMEIVEDTAKDDIFIHASELTLPVTGPGNAVTPMCISGDVEPLIIQTTSVIAGVFTVTLPTISDAANTFTTEPVTLSTLDDDTENIEAPAIKPNRFRLDYGRITKASKVTVAPVTEVPADSDKTKSHIIEPVAHTKEVEANVANSANLDVSNVSSDVIQENLGINASKVGMVINNNEHITPDADNTAKDIVMHNAENDIIDKNSINVWEQSEVENEGIVNTAPE